MKHFVFLLAGLIFLLSIKPGVDILAHTYGAAIECCKISCATSEMENKKQDTSNTNDCEGENCNPFQSCCAIPLICKTLLLEEDKLPIIHTKTKPSTRNSLIAQFEQEFWQPPKIIS